MAENKRDGFVSRFGVLVALAGSAIGLGNLWRFPYLVGNNGGAAFIIMYVVFVIFLCLPIMISEFVIGRRTQANVFGGLSKLAPKSGWPLVGILSVAAVIFIMAFYFVVGGWTIEYILKSFSVSFLSSDRGELASFFGEFISSPISPAIMMLVFLGLTALIVLAGIKEGIEKYSKIMMPGLFILIIILCVRSLTLPGAAEGVRFLFHPDFSKLRPDSALAALGQAFFSLSLGMGCMITYGSYIAKKENLIKMSLVTAGADTLFAILAGIAIMPAVFAFGMPPAQGPGLVFIILPQIFSQMPFGNIFSIAFFVILFVAAITSAISMLEVVVAYFMEELKMTRRMGVLVTCVIVAILGTISSLSQGTLSEYTIFGKSIFDIFDYTSSNIMLPIGGLFIVLFVGWKMKSSDVLDEITSGGTIQLKKSILTIIMFCIKFLAPIAIALVLLNSIGIIKFF